MSENNEMTEEQLFKYSMQDAVRNSVITELVDMVKTSLYREYENMVKGALDVHGQGHQRTSSTPTAKGSIPISWTVEINPNMETNLSHNVRVRCKVNRTLELDDDQVKMEIGGSAENPELIVNSEDSPDIFEDEDGEEKGKTAA